MASQFGLRPRPLVYYPNRLFPQAQILDQGFVLCRYLSDGRTVSAEVSTAKIENLGDDGQRQYLWVDGEGKYSWDSSTHGALPPLTNYVEGGILLQSSFAAGGIPWITAEGETDVASPTSAGPSILMRNLGLDSSIAFRTSNSALTSIPKSIVISSSGLDYANNWAYCGVMWSASASGSNATTTAYSTGGVSSGAQFVWNATSYWPSNSLLFPGSGARPAVAPVSWNCVVFSPMASVGLAASVPRFPQEPPFMKGAISQSSDASSQATLQLPQMLPTPFALRSYSVVVVAA